MNCVCTLTTPCAYHTFNGKWERAAVVERLLADEQLEIATQWSDYRADYGVREEHLTAAHRAFVAGWEAAKGRSFERGAVR